MILISLSGPCGSGKSTILNVLNNEYVIMSTTYKKCNGAKLDPKTYQSKIDYTNKWFSEAMKLNSEGKKIVLSDRSPFDCLAYLEENIREYELEINHRFNLLDKEGIDYNSILIIASKEILKERILNRYHVGNRRKEWFDRELSSLKESLSFYDDRMKLFDLVIDNSNDSPKETIEKIKINIEKKKTTANK